MTNLRLGLFKTASTLDSSLKKNTAFIKRLRTTINGENQQILLKEIASLSLEKYLSEIVNAAAEGLGKCRLNNDIWAGVEVTSALHQRFNASFTPTLLLYLLRGFANPSKAQSSALTPEQREKEDSNRLIRQRGLLRLVTELWLCGIARTSEDARLVAEGNTEQKHSSRGGSSSHGRSEESNVAASMPIPLEILGELLASDLKDFTYLPLASAFVKNSGVDILGIPKRRVDRSDPNPSEVAGQINGDQDSSPAVEEEIYYGVITPELRKKFRLVLESYLKSFIAYIRNAHKVSE